MVEVCTEDYYFQHCICISYNIRDYYRRVIVVSSFRALCN